MGLYRMRGHRPLGTSAQPRRALGRGLLFVAPWILGFLLFTLYPMVASLYYSFTSYHLRGATLWVGLDNFREMFTQDPLFWTALLNTTIYTLVSVPLDVALALLLAVLLNQRIPGRAIFRTIFFLPTLVPPVVTAITWKMLYSTQGGLLNTLLSLVGLPAVAWLDSPEWAMRSLIVLTIWGIGGTVVIFLAGLQDVPTALYEAARLDGAGSVSLFWHITVPLISPVILFNFILGLIYSFQTFAVPFIMTGGGPLNATILYPMLVYQAAFSDFRLGYASAEAWLMFVLIFSLSLLTLRFTRDRVFYS